MQWRVVNVEPHGPLAIAVRFADGTEGVVRFKESHLTGIFETLKNPDIFRQVHIEFGAVAWPGNIDLAPDAMYREIRQSGEWVLQ